MKLCSFRPLWRICSECAPTTLAHSRTARKRADVQYRSACEVISGNPLIGHPAEEIAVVREFKIPPTPFSFIYRVHNDQFQVLRVWVQRGDRSGLG